MFAFRLAFSSASTEQQFAPHSTTRPLCLGVQLLVLQSGWIGR